ncbi:hypothetical protein OCU04_009805 [Sclerotinia nivalis]|uniref:Uncharacterized protein n=1 Tax=Sclerotinia nivalis TaxID=352851 RepID=A0A9X0AFS4_9HELO|nr:hypothetical protein OCU04_009805 [Sclerotinia nivalis]
MVRGAKTNQKRSYRAGVDQLHTSCAETAGAGDIRGLDNDGCKMGRPIGGFQLGDAVRYNDTKEELRINDDGSVHIPKMTRR